MSNALMDAISYVGGSLEKPGRAVRGVLAGKGREALNVIPFSDSLGITDERDRTTGRDLTDLYGLTNKYDKGLGSWGAGLAADTLTDPLSLLGAGAAFKAAPTVAKGLTAGAKSLAGLDLLDAFKKTPGRGATVASKAGILDGADDIEDTIRGSKVPGRMGFGGDLDDEAPSATARFLRKGNAEIGYAKYRPPGPMEASAASRAFPGIVDPSDAVRRIDATYLNPKYRGKGLGQATYLDMMGQHPGDWFYNSQASAQAAHAADALEAKGLIEHYRMPGVGERPHVGRITDAGLEALSHPDLLLSLYRGDGFPSPLPIPLRRPG